MCIALLNVALSYTMRGCRLRMFRYLIATNDCTPPEDLAGYRKDIGRACEIFRWIPGSARITRVVSSLPRIFPRTRKDIHMHFRGSHCTSRNVCNVRYAIEKCSPPPANARGWREIGRNEISRIVIWVCVSSQEPSASSKMIANNAGMVACARCMCRVKRQELIDARRRAKERHQGTGSMSLSSRPSRASN